MFSEPKKAAIHVPELKLNVMHRKSSGNHGNKDSPYLMEKLKKSKDSWEEDKGREEKTLHNGGRGKEGKEAKDGGEKEEEETEEESSYKKM